MKDEELRVLAPLCYASVTATQMPSEELRVKGRKNWTYGANQSNLRCKSIEPKVQINRAYGAKEKALEEVLKGFRLVVAETGLEPVTSRL